MAFWVYILRCRTGHCYVGSTENLEVRLAQHESGFFEGYTSTRLPVILVYSEEVPTRTDAVQREFQIKNWSRGKKEAFIQGDFDRLYQLAKQRTRKKPR